MSDEAEEFKRQEERFDRLAIVFSEIWMPDFWNLPFLSFDLYRDYATLRIGHGDCYIDLFTTKGSNKLLSLRALNDRLELALQGKVKDADT